MPDWFEDEDFWAAYAPLMFDEAHWAEVPAVCDALVALAGLKPGAAVLDACCGPGRHSLELAGRGYAVTGLDLTEAYLEAARGTAEGAFDPSLPAGRPGAAPEFLRGDVRDFVRPGAYDLVLNLFTSFGYFATRAEDIRSLSNFRACLAPGGALVLETLGKETAARDFVPGESFDRAGWSVRTEFRVEGAWEGLRNRWILERGGEVVDRAFTLRLYAATELREALLEAGFSEARAYGSLAGEPYDQGAASLVMLARA